MVNKEKEWKPKIVQMITEQDWEQSTDKVYKQGMRNLPFNAPVTLKSAVLVESCKEGEKWARDFAEITYNAGKNFPINSIDQRNCLDLEQYWDGFADALMIIQGGKCVSFETKLNRAKEFLRGLELKR